MSPASTVFPSALKLHFLVGFVLTFGLFCSAGASQWQRGQLIYHRQRSDEQWRGHIMRADSAGKFNEQLLLDCAILTTEFPGGTPTVPDELLNEQKLTEFINNFITDASKLNDALSYFSSGKNEALSLSMVFGVPYFAPKDVEITLSGTKYRLSDPSQRQGVAKWYLRQLKSAIDENKNHGKWRHLSVWGIFYMREDILDFNGDVEFVKAINEEAHSLKMASLWVPYYDAPYAWKGEREGTNVNLNFDIISIQPRYAFLSSLDSGDLKGDRLYSTGYHSAALNQSFEYELRSSGESLVEFQISHQYLAISQVTKISKYPQVFFFGGHDSPEIFDRALEGEKGAKGYSWKAYEDLCNYLKGDSIPNLEVQIPLRAQMKGENMGEIQWVVPKSHEHLNSIRLDFNDYALENPWRGRVTVFVCPKNSTSNLNCPGSWTVRVGSEEIYPQFSSVYVPIANLRTPEGTKILIQISRESSSSPWPKILQLVGGKFEPLTIANPIFQQVSKSSRPNILKHHADSKNTHLTFDQGKLTDGKISPYGNWWDGASMGWEWSEYPFSITIDLGRVVTLSKVNIITHFDLRAGVRLPVKVGALASSDCEPHSRGTGTSGSTQGCLPVYSTGKVTSAKGQGTGTSVTLTLPFTYPNSNKEANMTARYITISGNTWAWFLLDEVQVFDAQNRVVSQGARYRVTPIPGSLRTKGNPVYGDNNQILLDGNVFSEWVNGYGIDGMEGPNEENGNRDSTSNSTVEATWSLGEARRANWAVIWITDEKPSAGVKIPEWVNVQYRNEKNVWSTGEKVAPTRDCGPSPCVRLRLPNGVKVSGVRGTFPSLTWFMVTEISVE